MRQYLELCQPFVTWLAILVYILAGQLGMGTEMLSLQYRNTVQRCYRNIYIKQGMVGSLAVYSTEYKKDSAFLEAKANIR